MTENTQTTPAVERAAHAYLLALGMPEGKPDIEDLTVLFPAALSAALDVEEMADAVPRAMRAWSNGTKPVWVQLGPEEQKAIAEAIRTTILGNNS